MPRCISTSVESGATWDIAAAPRIGEQRTNRMPAVGGNDQIPPLLRPKTREFQSDAGRGTAHDGQLSLRGIQSSSK